MAFAPTTSTEDTTPKVRSLFGSLQQLLVRYLNPPKTSTIESLKLPGCGLPLQWFPADHTAHFPVVLGHDAHAAEWKSCTLLIREVCMLKLMEELTNKPSWWTKVRDPEISEKWKAEALAMDWASLVNHADFTPLMADSVSLNLKTPSFTPLTQSRLVHRGAAEKGRRI